MLQILTIVQEILARRAQRHLDQGFQLRPHPLINDLLQGMDATLDEAIASTVCKLSANVGNSPPEKTRRKNAQKSDQSLECPFDAGSGHPISEEIKGGSQNRTDDKDFADPCLTTWPCRRAQCGDYHNITIALSGRLESTLRKSALGYELIVPPHQYLRGFHWLGYITPDDRGHCLPSNRPTAAHHPGYRGVLCLQSL